MDFKVLMTRLGETGDLVVMKGRATARMEEGEQCVSDTYAERKLYSP
jgi:hypothetical protein